MVIVWEVVSETSLAKQFYVVSPNERQTQPLSIPTAGSSSLQLPLESKKLRLEEQLLNALRPALLWNTKTPLSKVQGKLCIG